jgi:hypothetical protein
MSPPPTDRRKAWPSQLPFGFSAGEAQHWLNRGAALGSLLNLLLRRRWIRVRLARPARSGESAVGRARRS